ncbi:hypothetical protein MCOR16_009097 [Pyricularia oryzae]|nr:hypothetical protein MCOR15_004250 [Pyricularia oryzae]KAI6518246.1 hypothetical protein MCOR16_009097 [Pyricularia oryzae]
MQDQFGVHLLHSHHPIPDDTILLGTSYKVPPVRRWARPTRIEDLRDMNLHGHTYAVRDGCLRPYEFQSGDAPELSGLNVQAFLEEFCKLVERLGLQNQIALEILDSEATDRTPMLEFIVDQDNHVLVEAKAAQQSDSLRTTGWVYVVDSAGVTLKGNTAYAGNSGEHKTFTDGKPLTIEKLAKLVPAQCI